MSDYLDHFEQQLIDVTAGGERRAPRRSTRRTTVPAGAVAALAALLVASAVALAVSGTFGTGSAVRPPERASPGVGAGVATAGTRLLATRVPDPAGGLPWGLRLVHTTRRLVCLQVGRVEANQLGVLGQNGAFAGDGRFHPVSANVVGYRRETTELSTCLTPGEATSLEARIPQSGVFGSPKSRPVAVGARRWVSYGLLGPRAVSVTYLAAGQPHTMPVDPGSGAYLIVLPDPADAKDFQTGGGASSTKGYVVPQGAISSITYRLHAGLCTESRPPDEAASAHPHCPRPLVASRAGKPHRLNDPVRAELTRNGAATITFKAPHAVSSALSDYAIEIPSACHKGIGVTQVERDMRAGELVRVNVPDVFANACGRSVRIQVVYEQHRDRFALGEAETIVGETTLRR